MKIKVETVINRERKKEYDCLACLGFCCSIYENVAITRRDLGRLARHFKMKVKKFLKEFTRGDGTLKRKEDPLLGETCIFFDTEQRCCGVYEARPAICREWPKPQHRLPGAENRCCYFDVYQFAQRELAPNAVPVINPNHGVPLIQIGRLVKGEVCGSP